MKDFTEGNPMKQIISFALPMLVGNVFQQVYSMADTMVVGRYVGGSALAAVGTSSAILNFLVSVLIGLTTGASVVISQFYGAKQEEDLKRSVSTSIIFMACLAVVISVVGFVFAPQFLKLMGVPEDILNDSRGYLRVCMSGMLFPVFYNMYTAYLRALGDSKSPLFILIISTILNLGMDIIFVRDFGWGVNGAALATIISQSLAALFCYMYAFKYVPLLRVSKMVFDKKLFKLILNYSIPAAIQMSLTSLASMTIMRLVNSFGSVTVAGYTAAVKIDNFALMPLSNLSSASSTFVGQNMGAGLTERAKKGFHSSLIIMITVGLFVTTVANIFGKLMIAQFVDPADGNAVEIIRIGVEYLTISTLFYTFFAIFFSFNGFFRGCGDAIVVMCLTVASLTIRASAAHLLVSKFGMGPEAVAWSVPIGWGSCAFAAFIYYKKNLWVGKVAVKHKEAEAEV